MAPETKLTAQEMSFPSITSLFQESWTRFVASISGLFLVGAVSFLVSMVVSVVMVVFMIILAAATGFSAALTNAANAGSPNFGPVVIVGGVIGLIFIVGMTYFSIASTIAQILVVAQSPKKMGVREAYSKALPLVVPFFLTSLLSTLAIIGGYFILFLPGIVIAFFLSFSMYAVVLSGKKTREALRESYLIVKEHFGEILIRLLIIVGVYLFIAVFIPGVVRRIEPATGAILSVYMLFINMLIGWFMFSYGITLYHQARSVTDFSKKASMLWMGILAGIGWFFVIATTAIIVAVAPWQKIGTAMLQQRSASKTNISSKSLFSSTAESDRLYKKSEDLFKQLREANAADPNNISKLRTLANENIAVLQQAISIAPQDAKLYEALGNAYSWPNSSGEIEKELEAYQRAEELAPSNIPYINTVGDTMRAMKQYDQAILQYNKSIRISENSGYAYQGRGYAYYQLKLYDQAKQDLQKAIKIFTGENSDGSYDQVILQTQKDLAAVETYLK